MRKVERQVVSFIVFVSQVSAAITCGSSPAPDPSRRNSRQLPAWEQSPPVPGCGRRRVTRGHVTVTSSADTCHDTVQYSTVTQGHVTGTSSAATCHDTVQYSTVQSRGATSQLQARLSRGTIQYSTVQYSTVQYCHTGPRYSYKLDCHVS